MSEGLLGPDREETARAGDRLQVWRARQGGRRWLAWWLLVGPGVLVMLGENDAPSMLSYAASGATYGIGFFLPFVLLTFAMAYVAQEMTVRLGAVTKSGHAELIYRRFGRFWGRFAMADLLFTNFLTLITEFVGIVAGAGYFGVPAPAAVALGWAVVGVALFTRRYARWERITMALAACNFLFVPVALLTRPRWGQVAHALLFWSPLPRPWNGQTIILLMADIGATVTPWMLFFQQGAVTDKGLAVTDVREGRGDTALGALLAALAAMATIVATAPLAARGMNAGQFGAAQFAQALVPVIGRTGGALFALGVMEAGLVAAATISTSSAYAFGEVTGRAHSLNRPWAQARGFYLVLWGVAVLAGLLVLLPGFPLERVVLMVNVLAVLTMPPAIGFLLLLVNDAELMGQWKNGLWANVLGIGVGAFISLAGVVYAGSVVWSLLR
ncbi:conserved membrane protein of unknown function [Candidatus Hydrogenisulfobacillus filiaventi]|uniref:Divalent metal cation transporter n=1 Tax=Candidatus Hydrogenisulfobacillus filiaventi TaxID=2707344 RepID=A0A6F8ZEX7_9FIRM|nr:divalent metal cation transporter [Bacillota bacterium]CAB1128244.1 conserved membrane protein of unknown function [Candidatus Hydrogenisulfobacillus filiaventi]